MATEVFSIVDPAGKGDYTTLQSWEAAEQRDLTAGGGEVEIALCRSGNCLDTSSELVIAGWTTLVDNYVEIRADHGHEHFGLGTPIATSKAHMRRDRNDLMQVEIFFFQMTGMQMWMTDSTGAGGGGSIIALQGRSTTGAVGFRCVMNRCVIVNDFPGAANIVMDGGGQGNFGPHIWKNCVLISSTVTNPVMRVRRRSVGNDGDNILRQCTIIDRNSGGCLVTDTLGNPDIRTQNCYLKSGGTIYSEGAPGDIRRGGGDITSNGEATNPANRNVPFSTDFFVSTTSEDEDVHLVVSPSSLLLGRGDNSIAFQSDGRRQEQVPFFDFEGDVRIAASGAQFTSGSGLFDVGADQVPNEVGPAILGGYMQAVEGVNVSGFLGGFLSGGPFTGPTGYLGGYMLAKAQTGNELFAIGGGYMEVQGGIVPPADLGGFMFSIPVQDDGPEFLGGALSGLRTDTEFLGGCLLGKPDATQAAITRARTLVAATSETAFGQGLEIDAQIIFKRIFEGDIFAKLDNVKTFGNDVQAKVEVQKYKIPPTDYIQSVELVPGSGEALPSGQPVPNFDPNGARQVCVTASGYLGDGAQFVNAQIDFGAPFANDGNFKPLQSVSGFSGPPPWTACHDYDASGLYVITIRGQDNLGMVGMDPSGLNLASGAEVLVDYPAISISGTPRLGFVPPSLEVDFVASSSGVGSPPLTGPQSAASLLRSPTDDRIIWSLGNRETSRRKNPKTFYSSPGLYAPVLRYLYQHPSGGQFMVSDTLLVGFNR